MRIATTDEMDRTTPEDRNALKGQCGRCGEWSTLKRKQEATMPIYRCECGELILIKTIQSLRTWRQKKKRR